MCRLTEPAERVRTIRFETYAYDNSRATLPTSRSIGNGLRM
jgi:hypothetical protein